MTAEKQGRKEKAAEVAAVKQKPVERKKKREVKDVHCKDCKQRQNAGDHPGRGWCSYMTKHVARKVVDNKFPCEFKGFKSK